MHTCEFFSFGANSGSVVCFMLDERGGAEWGCHGLVQGPLPLVTLKEARYYMYTNQNRSAAKIAGPGIYA